MTIDPYPVQIKPSVYEGKTVGTEHLPLAQVLATYQHKHTRSLIKYVWAAKGAWVSSRDQRCLLPQCGPFGSPVAAQHVMQLLTVLVQGASHFGAVSKPLFTPPLIRTTPEFVHQANWLMAMIDVFQENRLTAEVEADEALVSQLEFSLLSTLMVCKNNRPCSTSRKAKCHHRWRLRQSHGQMTDHSPCLTHHRVDFDHFGDPIRHSR